MAVAGLLCCSQLSKCLLDLRKIKQGIVAEPIRAARSMQDNSFGFAPKCAQSFSIAGGSEHADKSSRALRRRNILKFAQETSIVSSVIGVYISLMRFLVVQVGRRVSCG